MMDINVSLFSSIIMAMKWKQKAVFEFLIKEQSKSAVYIFTNPSAWAGYDTRSIFKWSLTD